MKYIDADKLKVEIERRINKIMELGDAGVVRLQELETLVDLESFLDTLQEPEVDLENEFSHYCFDFKDPSTGEDIPKNEITFTCADAFKVARHFYELGKNAK